jgi:DNA-binding MarR family transcriptional regulator
VDKTDDLPTFKEIDKFIHQRGRLIIMSYLYVVDSADYLFIKNQTGLSWGNLSSHVSKLEEKGYVLVKKEFVKKKPHTILSLTEKGREAFREYKNKMESIFEDLPDK